MIGLCVIASRSSFSSISRQLFVVFCSGVVQSSRNTLHKWGKQILHVWAPDKDVANVVARAYASVAPSVRANTVVMVTTAHDAPEIFTNK